MTFASDPGKPLSLAHACARLRFRHLQFLDALGQTRNLRLAAERLHITQPAATKVLADIEEILGTRLFDRLSRGVRPNELGLFTLRYASDVLGGQRKFVEEFNALRAGGHGHLTLGGISGSAADLLPAAVAEMQRQRPLLVLQIFEQSSNQLAQWLAERKIEVMVGRLTDPDQPAHFDYERLMGERLHVVGGPHHPLRLTQAVEARELANWPWILYPPGTAIRKVSDDIFERAGLLPTSGVVETPSFLFSMELMQATPMLTLAPAALADKYVSKGLLSRIPTDLPVRMPDYGVVTRLGETPSPAAQAFIQVLREQAKRFDAGH
ncbi:LysR substrate-binding domain-containing protein [Ideonella livida]|uniref:LysR family transcriptional regulator n=1 Tax=Ideonella livida TaxID=2707176 RepID=A0A7C9PK41_9BURK|nr:LysR substrate-binding domain-containing protein [Ideonella livida]NDY93908.1 LysR family transcriptional regulator [Ideonella livida]